MGRRTRRGMIKEISARTEREAVKTKEFQKSEV